jgi:hypothetical protein
VFSERVFAAVYHPKRQLQCLQAMSEPFVKWPTAREGENVAIDRKSEVAEKSCAAKHRGFQK